MGRANMEKNVKMSQGLIVEANQKLDEMSRALNEADSTKKKLQGESQDLNRQIEECENAIAALQKNKISLTTQLEDTKRLGDGEARDRAALLTKYKNLMTEAENLRMRIDEENEKKNDALKGLSKAQAEIQLWNPSMRLRLRAALMSLRVARPSLLLVSRRLKSTLKTSTPRLPLLRSPSPEWMLNLRNSPWNMRELMLLP